MMTYENHRREREILRRLDKEEKASRRVLGSNSIMSFRKRIPSSRSYGSEGPIPAIGLGGVPINACAHRMRTAECCDAISQACGAVAAAPIAVPPVCSGHPGIPRTRAPRGRSAVVSILLPHRIKRLRGILLPQLLTVALVGMLIAQALLTSDGFAQTPSSKLSVFHEAADAQQSESRKPALDYVLSTIVARVAAPLILDADREAAQMRRRHLDATRRYENAYLELASKNTEVDRTFVVDIDSLGDGKVVKIGYTFEVQNGQLRMYERFRNVYQETEVEMLPGERVVIPTKADLRVASGYVAAKDVSGTVIVGVRRHPVSRIAMGYFANYKLPVTAILLIADDRLGPDAYRRAVVALDMSVGRRHDGTEALTEIEYTMEWLAALLYFHIGSARLDAVVWTGEFGSTVMLQTGPPHLKVEALDESQRVSVMVQVGKSNRLGRPISYNPQQLRLEECEAIIASLPSNVYVDMLLVDAKGGRGQDISVVEIDGKKVALISVDIWRKAIGGRGQLRIGAVRPVEPTKALRKRILGYATCVLPQGTRVLCAREDGRIGIFVQKPRDVAMARCTGSVDWLLFDSREVNRIMGEYALAVGEEPLIRKARLGISEVYEKVVVKKPNRPAPLVMLDNKGGFIEVDIGPGWINPAIEVDRRNAWGFSYDEDKKAFTYYDEGVPPVSLITVQAPRFTGEPKLDER